eukprot:symbB.v1.2.027609.t1/scaffold2843.1/size69054/7
MLLNHAIVLTSAVGLSFAACTQRSLFDALTSIVALACDMIVLQDPGTEYDQMKWRDLYKLVRERRLQNRRIEGGVTKEVLKGWLLESDQQKKHATQTPSSSSQKDQGKENKLAELLNPKKGSGSDDWASKASAQKGKEITQLFLDVRAVPSNQTDALDPQEAVDGLIPSVAIDKFLTAADTLNSTEHIAFLFGKKHRFGKGTASCTRMVVRSMVCGFREQFTLELLQEESRENGTEIAGIMHHADGNAEGIADFKEFIDGNMLRFLPDEEKETEIRQEDFSNAAVKKLDRAVSVLQRSKEAAEEPTIAQKLEVVRWFKEMLEERCKKDRGEDSEPEDPRSESDHENRKRIRKKQRRRTTKKKKAMTSPCSAGHARHGAKRGTNMQVIAQQKFPGVVTKHINIMRWVKSSKEHRWEDLPEQVQQNHRDVPDDWRRAFSLDSKGRTRLQQVPGEVLQALDKHMVLVCQGISAVTQRNEEVLLHEIVTTAEQLCEKYNQKLQGEYDKWQETQRQMAQDVLDSKIAPQVALEVAKKMPKLEFAPEKLSKAWAFRFRKAFGWVKRVTNTQGVYLPYEHPKMQAARADFERDLSAGIDRRLYLNVDQERAKMGSMGKSDPKALGVSLHDHISRSRASITVMTSSWGDCTPGPLGMCVPSGLMPESELKKFNEAHRGVAYAIMSSGRSHFMTGSTWTEMLYQLYTPALDKQRQKYTLTSECRGRFLADAWTGFRSAQDGEAVERTAWERLNNMQMPASRPGGWSSAGQPVDQLHNSFRRELQKAGAEDLQYVANLCQRPEFRNLQLSKSGQAKRTAALSSRLLENTLTAWLRVSDKCFTAAWATCGYVTKDTAVDLQAAAKDLDPSGLQTAWGALEHASVAVKHSKAARTEDGAVDYINGGQFKLAGPNVPPSPIQCVALTPEEPSRPWRLEEYEDDDDDEVDVPEGADENPEEENDMSDSVSQDAEMLAPQGLEKAQVQTRMEQLEGLSDSGDEFLAWRYEPEETEALETPADDMTAKQTLHMTTAAEVLRPRGKLTSAEWLLLEREGFIDRLPQVQYTTISKHKKFGAWSTKYPADGGMIHFSRSYGEQRTPLVALLLCLEWLVDRHLETVLAGGDDFKILRQQLETRRFLEVPFAMKSVCVRKILDDLQTD